MIHQRDVVVSPDDPRLSEVCTDCKQTDFAAYMVQTAVWKEAGLGEEGCCLDCLAKRLGRKLTTNDFYFGSPINWFLPMKLSGQILRVLVRIHFPISANHQRNIYRSVIKMRRDYPDGITLLDFYKWLKMIGVNVTEEDWENAWMPGKQAAPKNWNN